MLLKRKEAGFGIAFAATVAGVLLLVSLPLPSSSSGTTVTSTSDGACPSKAICGSFSLYEGSWPIQVKAVYAVESPCDASCTGDGTSLVTISATLVNAGFTRLVVLTSSAGVETSLPSNSTVLKQVPVNAYCMNTDSETLVPPGGSITLSGPVYCTGYHYELVGNGTADVTIDFYWGSPSSQSSFNFDAIFARFDFG